MITQSLDRIIMHCMGGRETSAVVLFIDHICVICVCVVFEFEQFLWVPAALKASTLELMRTQQRGTRPECSWSENRLFSRCVISTVAFMTLRHAAKNIESTEPKVFHDFLPYFFVPPRTVRGQGWVLDSEQQPRSWWEFSALPRGSFGQGQRLAAWAEVLQPEGRTL